MSLVRFDFDYNQAFTWRAENTEAELVYTEEQLSVDQVLINKDISRVAVFPINKYSNDTSDYFFRGWTHVKAPFPYKQGDMDGGSFVQHFWNFVALVRDHVSLLEKNTSSELRFGYVSDNGKRCSVVIKYHNNDPSKWVACVTKDTEKNSFDKRHATLFLPKYFSSALNNKLKSNQHLKRLAEEDAGTQLANALGSELLAKSFKTFFDAKGGVNSKKIENFQKNELIKVGHLYAPTRDWEDPLEESPRHYKHRFSDAIGATVGGAAGWYVGVFIVGPLLALPTLGLSLIFAPPVCVLAGAAVGMLFGRLISLCCRKSAKQPVRIAAEALPEPPPPEEPTIGGGSHTHMAKQGVQPEPNEKQAPASPRETETPPSIATTIAGPAVVDRPAMGSKL